MVQEVVLWTAADRGTFKLDVGGTETGDIKFDEAPEELEVTLEEIASLTNVSVTGTGTQADPWTITFEPSAAGTVPTFTVVGASSLVQVGSSARTHFAGIERVAGTSRNDIIVGNAEANVYVFEEGFGNDLIVDDPTASSSIEDVLDLRKLTTPVEIEDVAPNKRIVRWTDDSGTVHTITAWNVEDILEPEAGVGLLDKLTGIFSKSTPLLASEPAGPAEGRAAVLTEAELAPILDEA